MSASARDRLVDGHPLFLLLAPFVIVSLVLHELAHAMVACELGDPTPRSRGG